MEERSVSVAESNLFLYQMKTLSFKRRQEPLDASVRFFSMSVMKTIKLSIFRIVRDVEVSREEPHCSVRRFQRSYLIIPTEVNGTLLKPSFSSASST
ncbi:hypothetical protein YC2023_023474 [Brassica napus]